MLVDDEKVGSSQIASYTHKFNASKALPRTSAKVHGSEHHSPRLQPAINNFAEHITSVARVKPEEKNESVTGCTISASTLCILRC